MAVVGNQLGQASGLDTEGVMDTEGVTMDPPNRRAKQLAIGGSVDYRAEEESRRTPFGVGVALPCNNRTHHIDCK